MGDLEASLQLIERRARRHGHLVALGGDHTVSLPLLRALAQRRGGSVGLIHFDAHVDTWPGSFGLRYGHGSVFYHAICEGLVDPRRMVQIGIRSPTERAVRDWTLAQGVRIIAAAEVHEDGPVAVADAIRKVVRDGQVYLSFDIDARPGVRTRNRDAGGRRAEHRRRRSCAASTASNSPAWIWLRLLRPRSAEITALAGATMVWEYLALVAAGTPASSAAQDAAAARAKEGPLPVAQ